MAKADKRSTICTVSLFVCCGLLVYIYANLFSLYRLLNSLFGSSFIKYSAILFPLIFISILLIVAVKFRNETVSRLNWNWIALGTGCCAIALLLPDPNFAAKRIHVTEYLILSLLVRYTLSHRLSGTSLLLFSCLLTGLLGIHEEFLQGLHPQRTYGLKDMLVNGIAGTGGGFMWHGLQLFTAGKKSQSRDNTNLTIVNSLYLNWLAISVLTLIIPISGYLHARIPFWTILPLGATLVAWACYLLSSSEGNRYGINVTSCCSIAFLFYPALINGFQIPFY